MQNITLSHVAAFLGAIAILLAVAQPFRSEPKETIADIIRAQAESTKTMVEILKPQQLPQPNSPQVIRVNSNDNYGAKDEIESTIKE